MNNPYTPTQVLLVGSIPLSSTEDVFMRMSKELPNRLSSIPDGETGVRFNYIAWQLKCFPLETVRKELGGHELGDDYPKYSIEDIGPTHYDEVAIASYTKFKELQTKGILDKKLSFQVCLPTPMNSIQGHIRPESHRELEPLYERRINQSIARIISEIPHEDLIIQWDLCFDVVAMEYEKGHVQNSRFKAHFTPVLPGIIERVKRVCNGIPRQYRIAFHLCYGDLRHQHFVEPKDLGLLVELTNAIAEACKDTNTVAWFHMPVPKSRTDEDYFKPLKALNIHPETLLYLGLIHAHDVEGTRQRVQTAWNVYGKQFGVATECGMGRTPSEELESILSISRLNTERQSAYGVSQL